uniref:7TM GPCR serpentine receptor class x (Srx) domain-containing protein n=1 Tax=Panagrolaimus sp. JU765 TaxID=591449 RepID=A0AC34RSL2_9BILA
MGHLIQIAYYIVIYSQLFKAINRLTAIASPINYRRYFSGTYLKYYIFGPVLCSFVQNIIYFIPECNILFDPILLKWEYDQGDCAEVLGMYVDTIWAAALMGIILFIDFITLFIVIKTKSKLQNRKTRREFNFFIQTLLTSIIYSLLTFSPQISSLLNDDKWTTFLSTTFIWLICHMFDG